MKFVPLAIPEVILIEPKIFSDDRGYFFEMRHQQKFIENGIDCAFVQENFSHSKHGVLRGLHYQIQQPQGKLVRVLSGEIFDVAVDIRRNSPTFGQWVSAILSSKNGNQLWVPAGFAHGFYVMSDTADVMYCCNDFYAPQFERSLIWNDPQLAIDWPLTKNIMPLLSPKDAVGKILKEAEVY